MTGIVTSARQPCRAVSRRPESSSGAITFKLLKTRSGDSPAERTSRGTHPKSDIVLVLSNPRKTLLYKYVYTDLTQGSNRLKWLQHTQMSVIFLSRASKLALRNFYGLPNVRATMCKLYMRDDSRSSLAQATHSNVIHVTISLAALP